jgi:hypothetical protein
MSFLYNMLLKWYLLFIILCVLTIHAYKKHEKEFEITKEEVTLFLSSFNK